MADWSEISSNFDADAERQWKEMRDRHFKERTDLHQEFKAGRLSNEAFAEKLDDFQRREQEDMRKFIEGQGERQAEMATAREPRAGPEHSRFLNPEPPIAQETAISPAEQLRMNEENHRQIAEQQAAGTLQPVSFDLHVEADAKVFDDRRRDVRNFCRDEMQKEMNKTLKGIDDPEVVSATRIRIEEDWKIKQNEQMKIIERDQEDRLQRTQGLYGRK